MPKTTAPAKTAPAPKSLKPCSCSLFEVGDFDALADDAIFTTDCTRQTNRLFAQGHDAKLVSFLVKGELDGYTIRLGSVTFTDAAVAAGSISPALASKAQNMLRVAAEKTEARAARQAEKAIKKAPAATATTLRPLTVDEQASVTAQILGGEPQDEEPDARELRDLAELEIDDADDDPALTDEPRQARIRVGRWSYDATIRPDGSATYTTKLGKEMTAGADTYTLV